MHTTPLSLLERIRMPDAEAAWNRFIDLYAPLMHHWARKLGADTNAAADLVQDVFVILLREMPRFEYRANGRFRGWLWTVLVNQWRTRQRRLTADRNALNHYAEHRPDPLETTPPALDEAEYRAIVVHRAMQLMRSEFPEAMWQACWDTLVLEHPPAEVARRLDMTINMVYLARSRILRRLRTELAGLLE
jgi:RNA polymerase sigma-70 factor (ECF subfamily)